MREILGCGSIVRICISQFLLGLCGTFCMTMIFNGSLGILTCLSHYNSLYMITVNLIFTLLFFYFSILQGHLYIIDVSQSVDLDHPSALEFLKEDCLHVTVGHTLLPF